MMIEIFTIIKNPSIYITLLNGIYSVYTLLVSKHIIER